ncbi:MULTISPECIES: hypothetical protein [unclassified Chelatococcus]|jgi:hypothetical protein|uniref:hypothetical protein n=1 Tax=unclassified Chelatococcus TaxID=2638111 RepID=UPI001BCFADCE|nr:MULTISPECIES: hypothetical protein [unclassified Chelatococcus]MBS7741073.1 hypothetical protein [Chelatococcus sp. HY11]MBX3545259.1 hypothetical protein [Chelatococcus sp.]CAH1660259.1 hypothetical protein CHELA41_21857 [Hyphomicrobiales bacterium]CAH1683510.1 hypothetical protein CHELA20_53068 [Hyphomicrobiales bacterium]
MQFAQSIATAVASLSFWTAIGYTLWRSLCHERGMAAWRERIIGRCAGGMRGLARGAWRDWALKRAR